MNKLISKNPIQRFKQGQKIIKAAGGFSFAQHAGQDYVYRNKNGNHYFTRNGYNYFSNGDVYNIATGKLMPELHVNYTKPTVFTNPTKRKVDSGADWRAAHQAQSEKAQVNKPQVNKNTSGQSGRGTKANTRTNNVQTTTSPQAGTSSSNTPTLSNTYVGYATPETSKVQNVNQNWTYRAGNTSGGFVPTQSSAQQSVTQQLDEGPSFYGEGLTDFNRGSIRGFRNQDGGFRNVDEYYTWLNNNQNSDQYKLWNNVLEGMDDETRRNTFNQIMNQFGISGNLGRRDSERLAEVLNILRDLGVNGSANQKAFMNSYNTALNNELTEARRNASPITSYTEQLRNQTLNARPSLATAPYIVYKKGGLISKNPVEQFKSKDLTKYQLGGWLKRMITGKPSKGGTYGGGRSGGGGATVSWDTETEDATKEEKKKRYTIVQSKKLKSKKDQNKENNSKPKVTSKSKVASSNKPNLIDQTLSEVVVTAKRPEISANFATQPNMEISQIAVPQIPRHYNRRQTREYIRTKGLNPYHMGSLQRKQLRKYLNGELTSEQVSPTTRYMAEEVIHPNNDVYNNYNSNGTWTSNTIADVKEFFKPVQ